MYTLGAGRILIKSIIIVCLLNLMAWKVSWAHRTGENEKKDNYRIKKSVQTSSACDSIYNTMLTDYCFSSNLKLLTTKFDSSLCKSDTNLVFRCSCTGKTRPYES